MQNNFVPSAVMHTPGSFRTPLTAKTVMVCFLAVSALLSTQGCAPRPPNCTDEEILLSAIDNISDTNDKDTAGLRDYKKKVSLSDIKVVQNEVTKANGVCLTQLTVNSPSGQSFVVKMGFRTVNIDGKIVRLTEARQGFTDGVTGDMQQYVKDFDKNQPAAEATKAPLPVSIPSETRTTDTGATSTVALESSGGTKADTPGKIPQVTETKLPQSEPALNMPKPLPIEAPKVQQSAAGSAKESSPSNTKVTKEQTIPSTQTYTGTLRCGLSLVEPRKPGFESPAVLTLKNGTALMKRGSDKFEELLEGRLKGQNLFLEGQGRFFSGGQPWITKIQGTLDSKAYKGRGEIITSSGERYRECEVSMVYVPEPMSGKQ